MNIYIYIYIIVHIHFHIPSSFIFHYTIFVLCISLEMRCLEDAATVEAPLAYPLPRSRGTLTIAEDASDRFVQWVYFPVVAFATPARPPVVDDLFVAM